MTKRRADRPGRAGRRPTAAARWRREARWQGLLRERAEEGLREVVALEPRLKSSGLGAGDWHVGRDAVGRARQTQADLELMRRHPEALLAADAAERKGTADTDEG